ncbi:MAG: 50S ribosomal protein L11 methyltransferase, partial [Deltaproteobacteria bacterium]|nr:50S ribosomal protein L11 methyltransferase [Deltaproteobacteria bacterium]
MTEEKHRSENSDKFPDSPYKDLYIYYLQGRLKPDEKIFDNSFIGNWQEDEFSFLFFATPSRGIVEKILTSHPELTLVDEFYMTYDQWQGGKITPFEVGQFSIIPSWQKQCKKMNSCRNQLSIILDPGVVFGAGTHTTTQDCLKALELVFSREKIESVLDLGTGTGLLALAASRLGCKNILAVDFNFLAASTALRNVRLNQLQDHIIIVQGRAEDFIDSPSDLVIANIHYDVMKHLIASPGFFNNKWFILSGLLRSQARDLLYELSQNRV